MTLPSNLLKFTTPIKVLDQGHVQLVDVMGNDNAIVDAARVSFAGKASDHTPAQNKALIRYLMRHHHWTPFEMCEIKLRVRVPMDCWRQWIRHRTASVNETSTRYTEALECTQQAEVWRAQSTDNKQGSNGIVTEWPEGYSNEGDAQDYLSMREEELQSLARTIYNERLDFGVAKEQARKDLPLSTYTEAYWKVDLRNLFNFLQLRLDSHAQLEIREFAGAIAKIVEEWVPAAWAAFEDYQLHATSLSRPEQRVLSLVLSRLQNEGFDIDKILESASTEACLSGREKTECLTKIQQMLQASTST